MHPDQKQSIKDKLGPKRLANIRLIRRGLLSLTDPFFVAWYRMVHTGSKNYIDPTAQFLGWKHISIGYNNLIAEGCLFNVNQRERGQFSIVIGDNCFIGRRNFFSPGKIIEILDFALTGPDCHYLGSGHEFDDPFVPYVSTPATVGGSIRIGVNCWLGADVICVGNIDIGHGCVIGAGTLVNRSIPPFSLVIGSPCRVVKRYDVIKKSWVKSDDFTAEAEAALPDEQSYLMTLQANAPAIEMPIAAAGRSRGDLP